ncbi:nicotinate-nucleotide--dimethylbenzimidazole phosphoribosyltransferase [Streptomyces sp. URMC 124]|uniref:nicotinate-nucleotide--dimethylbenzimidazole phosphoribosyltransferase n=1 Tax=Streptomyces sp. URMC 124 TaxID=3423405 RepID=UPI003F1A378E
MPAAGAEPLAAEAGVPDAAAAGQAAVVSEPAPAAEPLAAGAGVAAVDVAPADQAVVASRPAPGAEPLAAEVPAADAEPLAAEAVLADVAPAGQAAEPLATDAAVVEAAPADQVPVAPQPVPVAEVPAADAGQPGQAMEATAPVSAPAQPEPGPEQAVQADPDQVPAEAPPAPAAEPLAAEVPAEADAGQAAQVAEATAPAEAAAPAGVPQAPVEQAAAPVDAPSADAAAAVDAAPEQVAAPATPEGAQPEQQAGPVAGADVPAAAPQAAPTAAAAAAPVADVQPEQAAASVPVADASVVAPQAEQVAEAAAEAVADAQTAPQAEPAPAAAPEAVQPVSAEAVQDEAPAAAPQPEPAAAGAVDGTGLVEPDAAPVPQQEQTAGPETPSAAPAGEPSAPQAPAGEPQAEQAAVPGTAAAEAADEQSAAQAALAGEPEPGQPAAEPVGEPSALQAPAPVPQPEQTAGPETPSAAPAGEQPPSQAPAGEPQDEQATVLGTAAAEAADEQSAAQAAPAGEPEPEQPAAEPVGEPSASLVPAGEPQAEQAAVPGAPAAEAAAADGPQATVPSTPATEPTAPVGEPSAPSDPHAPAGVPQTEQAIISDPQAPATEDAAQTPAPEQTAADLPEPAAADDAQPDAPAGPQVLTPPTAPAAPEAVVPAPRAGEPGTAAGEDAPAGGAETEAAPEVPAAVGYGDAERAAVHRVMRERRDIRNGFRTDPIPHEVLLRVLEAAHTAPSVGHSQPWDFVVIRSAETRQAMHELAQRQRDAYAKSLPKGRAKQFKEMKIEAILETPVNIVVTADPTRGGRHTLGRHTQPQMAPYSSALAVENLWLAARAEGLGVGWVSFFDEREMVRALGLPEHLEVVAYLCVGYVDEFPDEPELMQAGWSKRRPLSWVVHEEEYGRRALPGEEPHDLLAETLRGIRPLDAKALGEAWERQKRMTKPSGALGMLEIISAQLCGLSRKCPPPIPEPAAVAIFAGDHGVHAQGVTAWPQEVTSQMVANFLGGGAVCNAFANQVGAEVCVVDVGVAGELPSTPGLLPRKVRAGTGDITTGPAMTREEAMHALEVGIETARDLVAAGNKALLTGEMGIANTTVSAALISVYTEADPAEITGRGTGINDEMHARKVDVVRRALELHRPDPKDPIGVLAAIGGLEHAALVGLILGGASLRTPVILDGVSAGAAALVARAIAPEALAACIAGHRSAEPGHVAALTKLGLRPLVDLDLRLGEGTGALLALPIVQSAARAMHEVATFDTAGVTEKA